MRTLTSTLTAAQKALAPQRPVIALEVSDRPVEMPRWDWAVLSDEAVATCHGAACLSPDGAVLRARVKTDGTLQVARIADPASDDWAASWEDLDTGCSTVAQVSIASDSGIDWCILAYAKGLQTLTFGSSDDGVTWTGPVVLHTAGAGATVRGLALAGGGGYVYIVWTVDEGGAEPNDTVRVSRWDGSGWSAAVVHGAPAGADQDTVMAAATLVDGGDQRVVLAGASGLYSLDYSWSGATWWPAYTQVPVASGSGWTLNYPRLLLDDERYYLTWLESWTVDVVGSRYWFARTPAWNIIGEALYFESNRGNGWDLLKVGGSWYAACAVLVYKCTAYSGAAAQLKDVGADVVAIDLREEGPNRGSRGRIWLNNADGRYATPGSGTYAMLREGSRVCLGLGYKTSAGSEKVWLPPLWVEGWSHVDEGGAGYLVLDVGDAWSYLERCRARYQVTIDASTLAVIAAGLAYRVTSGAVAASGGLTVTAASLTIRPGESIGAVLRRLLVAAGVRVRFGTTAVGSDPGDDDACTVGTLVVGSGSSGYSFGSASGKHPVLVAEYRSGGQPASVAEAFGTGYFDYAVDVAGGKAAGHTHVEQDFDRHLDSAADVDDRATRLLDEGQREASGGWLEVLPHLGAELYDVVDVTDSRAGLSSAVRRIAGIRWRYDGRKSGIWRQRLELEAV